MTYKFLWDARFGYATNTAADVRPTQEAFVRLVRFLDNLSSSIGVVRIASNYGVNTSGSAYPNSNPSTALNGQGFGYWDEQVQAGRDAWAVYRFSNSLVPFYVLIQWALNTVAGQIIGTGPGYPASHPDPVSGIAIQVAQHTAGTSPWGGTTRNDGTDTKTNPVWVTGSNGQLFIWPRTNAVGGTLAVGSRAAMQSLALGTTTDGATSTRHRFTVVTDENNLFICNDARGQFNNEIFYFGRYTPASGTNPPVPYWCFNDTNDPPFALNTVHGTTTPVTGATLVRDGGIATISPTLSGTVSGVAYDVPDDTIFTSGFWFHPESPTTGSNNPNLTGSTQGSGNTGVGILIERPILLYSSEPQNAAQAYFNGLTGYSYDFLRVVGFSVQPGTTLSGSTRMCIGNSVVNGAGSKWTVPWTGSLGPRDIANNRNGIEL